MLNPSPIIAACPSAAVGTPSEKEKMAPTACLSPPLKGIKVGCRGSVATEKSKASRLAFPFSAHRRKGAPPGLSGPHSADHRRSVQEAPIRPKHVFVSSPLRGRENPSQGSGSDSVSQPVDTVHAYPNPPRNHNGHSRHSLLLTKWVWSSRRVHHEEHSPVGNSQFYPPSGYGAASLVDKPSSTGNYRPRLHRRMPSVYTEEKKSDQPPLTIYPRQGEVSGLRDPYCARADRSFATVPLWTLNKILYLFALHLPEPSNAEDAPSGEAFEEAGSEASFNSESEGSTLIGSECDSEWESRSVSTACSSRQDQGDDDMTYGDHDTIGRMKGHNLLSLAVRRVNREPNVCTLHITSAGWLSRLYKDPRAESLKLHLGQPRSAWERSNHNGRHSKTTWPGSWYGLWELLIELAARDGPVEADCTTPTEKAKAKLRAPQPKEFRWLKLLGGKSAAKPAKPLPVAQQVQHKSQVASGAVKSGQLSPKDCKQPVWLPLLESSHPATG